MEPNSEETIGFIDVGTNSIHLLVVRFYPDSSGTPVFQDKESVRLGKSLYSTGRITKEAVAKSALVISRFARISRGLGADRVIAFATCAAREAANRQELIDAVSDTVELKVIPGTEEARLIALGVFGDKGPAERTLEIDIGGGSTEVIVREKGEDIFLDSLSMGAVRFNYALGVDCSQRVSQADYAMMMRTVDISSYHAVNRIQTIGFRRAVGSSGTLLSIAEMCAARRDDRDATYFTRKELHSLMQDLCGMTAEERLRVPGMGKTRADIIIPGGAIAEELMSLFGVSRMDVSPNGLKQGMMLDHQLSHGYTVFSARQSSVRALAHRCQYDRRHAETVERNAMSLFDQSRELGLHELDAQWRSLLSCACILHDIGELISYTNHNVLSQVIIEKADLQGFTCEEITAMGLIVRFHHKKFPGPKDARLGALPKEAGRAVRVCAMLLKMADVMDRHRNNAVRSARMRIEGSRVVLSLSADEDPSMEIWSLERLRPDFQKLFGLDLVPVSVDPLPDSEPVGMQVRGGKAGSASRAEEPDIPRKRFRRHGRGRWSNAPTPLSDAEIGVPTPLNEQIEISRVGFSVRVEAGPLAGRDSKPASTYLSIPLPSGSGREHEMVTGTQFFEAAAAYNDAPVKSGLCSICKGAHRLCGKDRCPLMIKFYSQQKTRPLIDAKDLAGSSPPSVFVGRYGYPKVDIGPLIPPEFGDTSVMGKPELWVGKSIDEIVDMRFRLVRGKYRIDATDFAKYGRIVDDVQEMALTERPVDVEASFAQKPRGRVVLDDDIEPFGPSARMEALTVGNGRFERNLERSFYDTDMRAVDAVVSAYRNGTLISEIQKAFSVGTMGTGKRRRFVPTRWSITAVDDIIGKDLLKTTKWNPTIDDFRLYLWEELDNRWAILMMPCTWRFELIEAWYPNTTWNPTGKTIDIIHDSEFFDGRTEYAHIGGCYYASRMAVNELLIKEGRTAGAVIMREAHPGYVMPVGVWNVRENVRAALRTQPLHFETLDAALARVEQTMDIKRDGWIRNSDVMRDWIVQRRIEDYYRHDPGRLLRRGPRVGRAVQDSRVRARPGPLRAGRDGLRAEPVRRVRARLHLLLRAGAHPLRPVRVARRPRQAQHRREALQGAPVRRGADRHRHRDGPVPGGGGPLQAHPRVP